MKRNQTQITVWPAITDLMTSIVVITVLVGVVGYAHISSSTTEPLVNRESTRTHILEEIKNRLEESGMRVEVLADQGILRLSENAINFPSGSVEPIDEHHRNVGWLAKALAEVVPCHVASDGKDITDGILGHNSESDTTDRQHCQSVATSSSYDCEKEKYRWLLETVLIEGHTDSIPVAEGSRFHNNLELSSMRSAKAYSMISACEPQIERIRNTDGATVLSTSGYGAMRPANPDSLEYNRRIDIRVLLEPPEEYVLSAKTDRR